MKEMERAYFAAIGLLQLHGNEAGVQKSNRVDSTSSGILRGIGRATEVVRGDS
jgi:hypothetical protein